MSCQRGQSWRYGAQLVKDFARGLSPTMLASGTIAPILFGVPDFKRWAAWSPLLLAVAVSIATSPTVQGLIALLAALAWLSGDPERPVFLKIGVFVAAGLVLLDFSSERPAGIYTNALSAAEVLGLMAAASGSATLAFVSGFTGSRASVAIAMLAVPRLWARPGVALALVVMAGAGLVVWGYLHGYDRFTGEAIAQAGELRAATYSNPGGLFGSGFGAYEGQRPHNVFISLWAQMGILSVPVWATVAYHLRRADWRVLLPLAPAALLDDWIVSTAAGICCLGVYFALTAREPCESESVSLSPRTR